MIQPKLVLIAGGSGSGKTYFVNKLMEKLSGDRALLISQDNYYKDLGHITLEEREKLNFDHPDSFDFELLAQHIQLLKQAEDVEIPVYDFTIHTRKSVTLNVSPKPVIILEGILVLSQQAFLDLADLKIFIDAPDDIRILRRLKRDVKERGRTIDSVMSQYMETVRPMHKRYVVPSQQNADMIISGEESTTESINKVLELIL
jgi:uridine kinase